MHLTPVRLIVQLYIQTNALDQVNRVLRSMKNYQLKPSLRIVKDIVSACARLGDVSLAKTLFASLQHDGIEPDAEMWSDLIKMYCHASLLEDADRALKQMRARGLTPDTSSYAEFLTALVRADQFTRAEAYFNSIRADTPINGRIWGRVIEMYIKMKNIDQAYALVDECLEKKINLESRVRNLLWSISKKKQRVEDYLKRFEKIPGNLSLEELQKQGYVHSLPN